MSASFHVTVSGTARVLFAERGENLFTVLRAAGVPVDSYCGGRGSCGKCTVLVNGQEELACRYFVASDISVEVPQMPKDIILTESDYSVKAYQPYRKGAALAFDIGTTTVVCSLLDENGRTAGTVGADNPQRPYGADVITRIRSASEGTLEEQCGLIRSRMTDMASALCREHNIPEDTVGTISVAGNSAMQQLFAGDEPSNLIKIPYFPLYRKTKIISAAEIFPRFKNAVILLLPDISAYVGADTAACVLATGMKNKRRVSLLVDIGTNGEMVLGNAERMLACATAAGPALEGAGIRFGMRGSDGAISSVFEENGKISCSVIGGCEPKGICGSGLIDAVSVFLNRGLLDRRGNILTDDGKLYLTPDIFLSQDDIRAFQLAKGAVAAGIAVLVREFGTEYADIDCVYLAGAFGSKLNPLSAIRTGLLPFDCSQRVSAVGNASCTGAKMAAADVQMLSAAEEICNFVEVTELGSNPKFRGLFAKSMYFCI